MVTVNPSTQWAEAYLRVLARNARAALVRGDELFVLSHSDDGSAQPVMELYKFVRHGETFEELMYGALLVEGGGVYFCFAWLEDMWASDDYEQIRECLNQAKSLLDVETVPDRRRKKVIELVRWSYIASSGDFSSLDGLELQPSAD